MVPLQLVMRRHCYPGIMILRANLDVLSDSSKRSYHKSAARPSTNHESSTMPREAQDDLLVYWNKASSMTDLADNVSFFVPNGVKSSKMGENL